MMLLKMLTREKQKSRVMNSAAFLTFKSLGFTQCIYLLSNNGQVVQNCNGDFSVF